MKIVKYKKPELAVLESLKKMRDYSEEERFVISKNLVENLLSDLGVGKNSDVQHHIRAIKHVSETLGSYTPEEIKKAFQLFISHKLNVDVFQQLNSVVIGRVMREYEIYKNQKLLKYKREMIKEKNKEKELTKEEIENILIEGLDRITKDFNQNGKITENCNHIYDWLFEKGKLPKDVTYKKEIFERAKLIALDNAEWEAKAEYSKHKILSDTIEKIKKGNATVITISKRLVLEDYFKTKNR